LRRGSISVDEALAIMDDLCAALDYAHGQGVVHCDLKPANVLFDEAGTAYVADFGIAHVSEDMMTRLVHTGTGMVMGTVRYMAPEQLDGVRDDPRVDVYALGALLYEMLAGRPYLDFETETTPAAQARNIARIQHEEPQALATVSPSVPAWLAAVTDRSLHKAPEARWPSAGVLREALRSPDATLEKAPPLVLALPDGRKFYLDEGTTTVGRDRRGDVVLADGSVSRRHAVIQVSAGRAQVVDLGSRNGTFVNGRRTTPNQPQELQVGDKLQLGPKTVLKVQRQTAPPPRPEPPAEETRLQGPALPTKMAEPSKEEEPPSPKGDQKEKKTRGPQRSTGCCATSLALLIVPRLLLVGWWLLEPSRFYVAVGGESIVALLGWILMPWLTLVYLIVFPGGILGFDWIWLGMALAADVATYISGIISRR
jgi:serine/threonine protein kinase